MRTMPTIQAFPLITSILAAHLIDDREREVVERASGTVVVTLSAERSRVAKLQAAEVSASESQRHDREFAGAHMVRAAEKRI